MLAHAGAKCIPQSLGVKHFDELKQEAVELKWKPSNHAPLTGYHKGGPQLATAQANTAPWQWTWDLLLLCF